MARTAIILGSILLSLAVLIGAFGAHGLGPLLEFNQRLDTFETANRYHFYHAIGLVLVGLLIQSENDLAFQKSVVVCFVLGVILFSGALYCLAIFNVVWLGAVAPIGGSLFIIGWVLLAWAARSIKTLTRDI